MISSEPSNPVGKVLIIDKILSVARYGGEARFADGGTGRTISFATRHLRWVVTRSVSTSAVSASATDSPARASARQPTFRFALVTVFPLLGRQ